MGLYDCIIDSIIKRKAIIHKERIAWKFGNQVITHGQFHENSKNILKSIK